MLKHALSTAAAFVACAAALHGSSPKFFQAATQTDFLRGEVENLSIDTRGQLTLGPATELVYETPAPFLWSLLPASDGTLFIGTGNDGVVYRVDATGNGRPFFDAPELEAHALAAAPDGGLYVGSSPDGKVYRVDRNGKSAVFFEPGEKYIWSLATDKNGNVYAGTGEKGTVYKIDRDGHGAKFFDTKATHATALAVDASGQLLIGTESPGRVIRVDARGKGFLLLDTPFQEIRSLRFDERGVLYVAAVSGGANTGGAAPKPEDRGADRASEPSSAPVASVSAEITSVAVVDVGTSSGGTTTGARDDRRAPKGAVYRVAPDGLWDQLWESRDDAPYDLAFDAQNRLIVATGNNGKIYRLQGDPLQATLVTRAAAQQVTSLHKDGNGRIFYATANPGKLFRLGASQATQGSYESEPRDAEMVASWGAVSWRGITPKGTSVEIFSRSGNTERPDDTWSDWSSAYTQAEGSAVTSPKARYLQLRAVLKGTSDTPILTSISAAYLQRNLRPQVRAITVHPPGIVFQKPYSTGDPDLAGFDNQTTPERELTQAATNLPRSASSAPALGRRTYQKGLQTLIWRADDGNDDVLSYDIWYRREGDTSWTVVSRELTDTILVWDTTTIANGTYFVKVTASDAPSNAADTALTGEMDSSALQVDNLPPVITLGATRTDGNRTTIALDVRDDHSPVQRVEWSRDGRAWRSVFPVDGIADSKAEHYELLLDEPIGPRGVTVRATDSMNNTVTTQVDAGRGR